MGIGFSHCKASWSYTGFNYFRSDLWKACGLNGTLSDFYLSDSGIEEDHPLYDLFNHSDCDGILTPEQCAKIAPALKDAIQSWDDDYDKENGLMLVEGMEAASKAKENLEFC